MSRTIRFGLTPSQLLPLPVSTGFLAAACWISGQSTALVRKSQLTKMPWSQDTPQQKAGSHIIMAPPCPSQSPQWASLRLRRGLPDRRDRAVIPVGWTCCKCGYENRQLGAYGEPAEIDPQNTVHLKPCAGPNCRSRKRDCAGNELGPPSHSLCWACRLTNHRHERIFTGRGLFFSVRSPNPQVDRSMPAFWECCRCQKIHRIKRGGYLSCCSGARNFRKSCKHDHPRLQTQALRAAKVARWEYFMAWDGQIPGKEWMAAFNSKLGRIETMLLNSAHAICKDCRVLNGYKEYLFYADPGAPRLVKGGVLWAAFNALWRARRDDEKALRPGKEQKDPTSVSDNKEEREKSIRHVWNRSGIRSRLGGFLQAIGHYRRQRDDCVRRTAYAFMGDRDPDFFPGRMMWKTKASRLQRAKDFIQRAVEKELPPAEILKLRQALNRIRDHGHFRNFRKPRYLRRPDDKSDWKVTTFKKKPSTLRQCLFTRQVPETDHRLRSTSDTVGQDPAEAEAYRQRQAAARRRYAQLCAQHEAALQVSLDNLVKLERLKRYWTGIGRGGRRMMQQLWGARKDGSRHGLDVGRATVAAIERRESDRGTDRGRRWWRPMNADVDACECQRRERPESSAIIDEQHS